MAIKTLNTNVQGKPNFREFQTKFVNEALSLARCSHPHVVQVYEVFPEMVGNIELWCMVMELIDGIDLASHLEDNGILSEAKALPIIQQVGSALSFVHKQGFTHLDVKPQNIMIRTPPSPPLVRGGGRENTPFSSSPFNKGGQGGAVLIDFGLARQVTAATLYVMLTGELPFPSQFRKPNIPLTPPKQFNYEISDRVNAAIVKGMKLEPQNRPQSVQEWLDLVIQKQVAADTTPLVSAVGMDYINLRNLLAAKKWREADEETGRVMLKVAGREKEGWLDTKSIEKFPCEDLRTIDQLWIKYSNGRFGFSVQKRIYQSLGGTSEYDEAIFERFGSRVGWIQKNERLYYNDLTFSEKAPEAHLPVRGRGGLLCGVVPLLSR